MVAINNLMKKVKGDIVFTCDSDDYLENDALLYMIDKIDAWTKKLGGEINNSFGEDLQKNTEKMLQDAKDFAHKVYQEKIKK